MIVGNTGGTLTDAAAPPYPEVPNIWAPNYGKYDVIDVETTVKAPASPWKFRGHPAFFENRVVMLGRTNEHLGVGEVEITRHNTNSRVDVSRPTMFVGHNVKFDLQYLAKNRPLAEDKFLVWDTGIAHYMMTAQKPKMPSLNEVAAFYGLGEKLDTVKDLWDMGVQTEDIEPGVLAEYLKQDVVLTHKVFLAQQERLKDLPKLRDHILRVSTASKFLGKCETAGLPVDYSMLNMATAVVKTRVSEATAGLLKYAQDRYNIPPAQAALLDVTTPTNIGHLLFDLPLTVEDFEPTGRVLASGKIAKRRKRIEVEFKPPEDSFRAAIATVPVPRTASGKIQTSDDLLDLMETINPTVVEKVKEYRAKQKLLGTYLEPTLEFITTCQQPGHRIYPTFHLTTTATGRSSSSSPNAQQIPPELEKTIRAHSPAVIVKADFKQLQMCGVAMLSGDKQLIEDLNAGRDVHYETGKTVFNWKTPGDMNKADRVTVKGVNFGLIFGGKAAGLAKQTGVSKKLVQQCIDAFYARYPGVKEWVDKNIALVEQIAVPSEGEFIDGQQVREAFLQTPAGRVLRFVEREVPDWVRRTTGRSIGFSPNEIANYPVQAYCDGDLALTFLALLSMEPNPAYAPINFVHDSVWVLTSNSTMTITQLQKALDELNTKMGLSVPLVLEYQIEDHLGNVTKVDKDGNKIG